jgi:hypothetical protein
MDYGLLSACAGDVSDIKPTLEHIPMPRTSAINPANTKVFRTTASLSPNSH